ncbi:hypothetical protein V2O64_04270 [Verrucomicrobiaceae bacterium 227]
MGRIYHPITFIAWFLVVLLSLELRGGTTTVELPSGTTILDNWNAGQHVYTVGNTGLAPEKLDELERWLDGHAPNWTVLLMESSAAERYTDVFGTEHRGIEAVENAMGKGLPASTGFGDLKDPETGLANGAFFILFLKDRTFSYYGDQAYQRYRLGAAQWKGNLDRPAIAAMKNGGRIIDAAKDTIQSIDERYRKAVVSEKARALKNLQKAEEGMEQVQSLMAKAGKQFSGHWRNFETPGTGAHGISPLEEWQHDFERLKGYQRDGHTMLQLGGLSLLEKKVKHWREGFERYQRDEPKIEDFQEKVNALDSSNLQQKKDQSLIKAGVERIATLYRNGDPGYLVAMSELEARIASFYRREEAIHSRQKMAGVAGASGVGFLGLMGFMGNRRRRRIKLEAETLLEKRKEEMKEMSDRLFVMMDRAAIVVGPVNELEARGYRGETLSLSREALKKIDEAFVLSSNVKKIIEESESLMEPANPLSKSRNLVSGGRYEEAVDLLDAEVRAESQAVPDMDERARPGEKSDEVFAMPLDEWKGRTTDALDDAESCLNEVDDAWTSIVARKDKLKTSIQTIEQERGIEGDEWLQCEEIFDSWVPAMKSALLAGSELGRTDPVSALRGPLGEGGRMTGEAIQLLRVVLKFKKEHWRTLEEGEATLDSRGRATVWVDRRLEDLSALCDEIAREGGEAAVAVQIDRLENDLTRFVERMKSSVSLAARAEDESVPAIKSATTAIERGRRELASALGLNDSELLVEEGCNPSIYLQEAKLQCDGALAALDLGEAVSAEGFLDEVTALVARALTFVEDSKRAHAGYPEASEELWKRRGSLEDLVKRAAKHVESMRARYCPSALFLEVGGESEDSYAGAPVLLEGFLVEIVKCLDRAKGALAKGRLLESWSLIEEGRSLAGAGEGLSEDVGARLAELGELEVSNREALQARVREKEDLDQGIRDRRVMKGSVVAFGYLGVKIRQATELVNSPEGRIDPYLSGEVLDEIQRRIPAMRAAISDDLKEYANAERLLETVKVALQSAEGLCETTRMDRIPDSRLTTEARRKIESHKNEWEEAGEALKIDHGDWRELQERLRTIHLGLSEAVMSLQKDLELARQAVRFLQTGAGDVQRAWGWSGNFGVRINGRPGGDALDRANQMMLQGSYQAAMEWAGRAQAEARSAIASAEAEESARALAEERRRARRAREAERSRMRNQSFGSLGGSAGSSRSSSSFGSRSSSRSSSPSSRSRGSSVGRSSFSSGSGVGRSGW